MASCTREIGNAKLSLYTKKPSQTYQVLEGEIAELTSLVEEKPLQLALHGEKAGKWQSSSRLLSRNIVNLSREPESGQNWPP